MKLYAHKGNLCRSQLLLSIRCVLLFSSFFCAIITLKGQDIVKLEEQANINFSRAYFEEQLSALQTDGLLSEEDAKLYQEKYEALLVAPLNVNTLSVEDLQSIPFISSYQCYQFINYRLAEGGNIQDLTELKHIEAWDEDFVEYIYPLLYVGKQSKERDSWNRLISEGQSRFSLFATQPLGSSKQERDYIGSPESLRLKYRWQSRRRISLFVAANKDNYEPWHYGRHRGFESYHAHAMLKDFGKLKQLILGQYRVSWGQGLILGQGFRSKSAFDTGRNTLLNYGATNSTSGYRLSQGLLIGLELSRSLRLVGLVSSRKMSAKIDTEDELAYALREGGLHRTARDWDRRNRLTQRHLGLQLAYEQGRWGIAWQGLIYDWNGQRVHSAVGASNNEDLKDLKSFANTSLAYRYANSSGRSNLSGEIALARNGALAVSQQLQHQDAKWGTLHLCLRYISQDYWAYLGQADTHYTIPHNEVGIRWGLIPRIAYRGVKLQLEGDWFRSISPRGRGQIQEGFYLKVNTTYSLSYRWNLLTRLSYRSNKKSYDKVVGTLALQYRQGHCETEFRGEYHRSRKQGANAQPAYLLSLRLRYKFNESTSLWSSMIYHQTEDWLNRAYIYEPRLSEQYGATLLYGKGARLTAGLRTNLFKQIGLGLSASMHYRSNLDELRGLLALQLSYKW